MPGAYDNYSLDHRFAEIAERFRAIEAQLAILSEKAGVPYAPPTTGVPPDVIQLAQAGKQLDAIKRYRELTGADLDTARSVVLGI